MLAQPVRYALSVHLPLSHAQALSRVREELAKEGFGVLMEADLRSTLQNKLGVDFRSYTILGACNPPLAHQALLAEPDIGLLLPCNVVVYDREDNEGSIVSAIDPMVALEMVENSAVQELAQDARERLVRALSRLEGR